jgi:ribosomal protein S18 acetylase RimI-like enzyme
MAELDNLAQRIERVCAATWPPIEEWAYDGWVLRFARGYTRRCNSVTPVEPGTHPLLSKIEACEAVYAARHIPVVFRLPSTAAIEELDSVLIQRGYYSADKTSIRVKALDAALPAPTGEIDIADTMTSEWLAHQRRWSKLNVGEAATFAEIVARVREPTAFALVWSGATPVAAGIGVLQEDLVCLHAIVAAPEARRRGFGRALTLGLLRWARDKGAETAYLQVVKANTPALRLYNELGFNREVYRYHYRGRPGERANPAPAGTAQPL